MFNISFIQEVDNSDPAFDHSNFLLLPATSAEAVLPFKRIPVTKEMFSLTDNFKRISLEKMDEVKLLNRFDSKFLFHFCQLQDILSEIQDNYYILSINDRVIQAYRTVYYDTPADFFYLSHHNGKLNRFKVRKRCYMNSGTCFLEVKFKDNKGKMKKTRITSASGSEVLTAAELAFISEQTGGNFPDLSVRMENSFNRITLVNRNFSERCTLDFNLSFRNHLAEKTIHDLVIAELKHNRYKSASAMSFAMKNQHIFESSFSKYCIGRALVQPGMKRNKFKPTLLRIDKHFKVTSHE